MSAPADDEAATFEPAQAPEARPSRDRARTPLSELSWPTATGLVLAAGLAIPAVSFLLGAGLGAVFGRTPSGQGPLLAFPVHQGAVSLVLIPVVALAAVDGRTTWKRVLAFPVLAFLIWFLDFMIRVGIGFLLSPDWGLAVDFVWWSLLGIIPIGLAVYLCGRDLPWPALAVAAGIVAVSTIYVGSTEMFDGFWGGLDQHAGTIPSAFEDGIGDVMAVFLFLESGPLLYPATFWALDIRRSAGVDSRTRFYGGTLLLGAGLAILGAIALLALLATLG
jgi:hypothetical protein